MYYRRRKNKRKAPLARTKADKCATKYCRNAKAIKSNGYALAHCWKCRSRMLKERRPETYVLNMLRHSARKRKLEFTLTLAEFTAWCRQTGYMEKRGNTPESLTVDRIDRTKGYHLWNIQAITHEENSAQGADNTPRSYWQEAESDVPENFPGRAPEDNHNPF